MTSPLVKDPSVLGNQDWDFVILGGGTAGSVLAGRLSEDASSRVLVVEAGLTNENAILAQAPALWARQWRTPADWEYYTTQQELANNREFFWPRGKMLGGSSSINAMCFHQCAPSDFDEWERLGATGWGYRDLAPYMLKSERYTAHELHSDVDKTHRGAEGVWHTGHPNRLPLNDDIIAAAKKVGLEYNPDFNGPSGTLGINLFSGFIDPDGKRSSAATAYLDPEVLARPNLTVIIETLVTKILFDTTGSQPRAIGVEVASASSKDNPRYTINAKEVIVCGGAINTPQILMLSGVGPKAHLEALKIPVVADLPLVGQKLKDHLCTMISLRAKPGYTLDFLRQPEEAKKAMGEWMTKRTGPMSTMIPSCAAFFRSDDPKLFYGHSGPAVAVGDNTSGPEAPDLEIMWALTSASKYAALLPPESQNVLLLTPAHLRPQSEGTITLKSTDAWEKPLIDPKYFSEENDIKVFAKAVRLGLRIAREEPLASKLELKPDSEEYGSIFHPGDADPEKITDEQIMSQIIRHAETTYHPVGTARIGKDASDSVVSPNLRVHGIQGLSICDASIFPEQLSGHPTSPIIAIAEKYSDMIKEGK